MKILYVGLKYDYGDPNRGLCLEYKNMYGTLEKMQGITLDFFATDENTKTLGREGMNEALLKKVTEAKPDLVFFVLFTEEIKKETVEQITKLTKTFNWFGDDHWRVYVYSRFWAPLFTLVSTTDTKAFEYYKSKGINNVIKTQWAVNTWLYRPSKFEKQNTNLELPDITFFGQKYGSRGEYIQTLKNAGLPAEGIGRGWGNSAGSSVEEMLGIYSNSKINLNFTETQYTTLKERLKLFTKLFIKKENGKLESNFQFFPLHGITRRVAIHLQDQICSIFGTQRKTIKARTFEVPACGGFLLTGQSDENINEYYVPGKEIVVFKDKEDLVKKCKYYLENESERMAIAKAGYARTLKEHTYENRFKDIFNRLNLN